MAATENRKRLIFSFLRLLSEDCNEIKSDEVKESLEVAMQCLGEVYDVQVFDEQQANRLGVSFDLQRVFNEAAAACPKGPAGQARAEPQVTKARDAQCNAEAQVLKERGNDLLRKGEFEQAVEMYTQAISIDGRNAIYYGNRAAAYMKLQQHERAVDDCMAAIAVDPSYIKAHSRLGNAYDALGRKSDAANAFRKAVELDPSCQGNRDSLDAVMADLAAQGGAPAGAAGGMAGGMGGGMAGLDFASMMSDPNFMSMASNLMNTPGFANMAASMMGGAAGGAPGAPAGSAPPGAGGFMQTAQRLAEQMQQTNPDLMEQVRSQMGPSNPPGGDGNSGNDNMGGSAL